MNVHRIIRQTIDTAKPAPAWQGARKRFLMPRVRNEFYQYCTNIVSLTMHSNKASANRHTAVQTNGIQRVLVDKACKLQLMKETSQSWDVEC